MYSYFVLNDRQNLNQVSRIVSVDSELTSRECESTALPVRQSNFRSDSSETSAAGCRSRGAACTSSASLVDFEVSRGLPLSLLRCVLSLHATSIANCRHLPSEVLQASAMPSQLELLRPMRYVS
jgi:hypothetical protein